MIGVDKHRRHLRPHEKGAALEACAARAGAKTGKTGRPKKSDTVSDISLNFHRRHLTPMDRGGAIKALMERRGAKKQQGKRTDKAKTSTGSGEVATIAAVAKKFGVPEQTARDQLKAAEDYKAAAPDLREKVDSGDLTLAQQVAHARLCRDSRRDLPVHPVATVAPAGAVPGVYQPSTRRQVAR